MQKAYCDGLLVAYFSTARRGFLVQLRHLGAPAVNRVPVTHVCGSFTRLAPVVASSLMLYWTVVMDGVIAGFVESAWPWVGLVLQIQIGGVLLAAAWTKVAIAPRQRVEWLATLRVLPAWLLWPVAVALPIVETGVGVAVLTGAFGSASPISAATLLALFTVVIAGAVVRGLEVTCGCFGALSSGEMISGRQIMRNLVLIAVSVLLIFNPDRIGIAKLSLPAQTVLVAAVTAVFIALAWRHHRRRARAAALAADNADHDHEDGPRPVSDESDKVGHRSGQVARRVHESGPTSSG